jgi:DNA-binding transcriptional ArsR family regulator
MAVRGGKEINGRAAGARLGPSREKQQFEVLHHPWRTRILEVLNERDMSVSQFIDEGLISDLADQPRDRAISALAYHFRALREAGAIEIVEQNSRRGSTELVCRACARAHVTDEEWKELPLHQRRAISRVMLNSLIARAESSVHSDTFDSRLDRHIAWLAMEVDEQGWSELAALMNGVLETVTAINSESKLRLHASGDQPIRATWGQLHFESPPLPPAAAG